MPVLTTMHRTFVHTLAQKHDTRTPLPNKCNDPIWHAHTRANSYQRTYTQAPKGNKPECQRMHHAHKMHAHKHIRICKDLFPCPENNTKPSMRFAMPFKRQLQPSREADSHAHDCHRRSSRLLGCKIDRKNAVAARRHANHSRLQ